MYLDRNNRAPKLELLPDRRLRVTRLLDVAPLPPKKDADITTNGLWFAWGVQDADFTSCRLIKQDLSGQAGEYRKPVEEPEKLILVYEEIPATAEVVVGNPDVTITQYGIREVTVTSIQFSAGTAQFFVPGTTTAPAPFQNCILRDQVATDDGTLRTIKRVYCEFGQLAQYDEIKFLGKVLIRTIKTLGSVPVTPTGFTLVTQSIEYINGLRVYAYGYASAASGAGAGGEISRDIEYKLSPDQGATGVTVTTIEYVTDSSVTSNPIVGPVGSELIEVKYTDESGYRLWRATYAQGTGLVRDDKDIREGGKLIIYSRTAINAVPDDPSPTIGGTVTLIKDDQRNGQDATAGTVIYDRVWAEGIGEISRDINYEQSGDQGTTGITKTTIRHIVALGATVQPTSLAGSVEIGRTYQDQDGYRIWTTTWGKGTGEVSRDIDYSQSNDQGTTGVTRTTIRYLVASGASVQPTSLSGSVEIGRAYVEQDGYRIWTTTWAKGTGLVTDDVLIQVKDALVVYHRTALGAEPLTPGSTIGGTVTRFETSVRKADGYDIYDYRWAEGAGQSSIQTSGLEDGALVYVVTTLNAAAATPAYPGSGTAYLVRLEQQPENGYFRNTATYKKPPATTTLKKVKNFKWPGLANFVSNELVLSPPSDRTILADEEISYATSQLSDVPYSVLYGAYFRDAYIRTNNNDVGESHQQMLSYTLAGTASISGTDDYYNGMLCDEFEASLTASSPTTTPSGLTVIDVDNEIYLVATDGTQVFRRVKVSYTF